MCRQPQGCKLHFTRHFVYSTKLDQFANSLQKWEPKCWPKVVAIQHFGNPYMNFFII